MPKAKSTQKKTQKTAQLRNEFVLTSNKNGEITDVVLNGMKLHSITGMSASISATDAGLHTVNIEMLAGVEIIKETK
jgi:CTP:phosphocholine cytidylyltransferase-like protein